MSEFVNCSFVPRRKPTPSPPVAVGVSGGNQTTKESWPSLQSGGLHNSGKCSRNDGKEVQQGLARSSSDQILLTCIFLSFPVGQTILSSSSNGTCNSSSSSVSSTGSNGSGGHTNNNNKGEGKKYQQGTGKNKKKNNASEESKG